jgi:hypothetical protein
MFYAAPRRAVGMWDHVTTSMSASIDITPVTLKRHAMAFHGFWCIAKPFVIAPKPSEGSDIIKRAEVATSWTGWIYSAVAAATGRRFKSRRPDFS